MRWLIPVSGIHDNGLERYGDNFPCRASFAFTSLLCARKMKGKGWVEFFFWREKWHFHDPLGIRGIGRHCCILAGTRCPDCWLRFPPRITGDIERIATSLSFSLSFFVPSFLRISVVSWFRHRANIERVRYRPFAESSTFFRSDLPPFIICDVYEGTRCRCLSRVNRAWFAKDRLEIG